VKTRVIPIPGPRDVVPFDPASDILELAFARPRRFRAGALQVWKHAVYTGPLRLTT
jgi:hypothetical protein